MKLYIGFSSESVAKLECMRLARIAARNGHQVLVSPECHLGKREIELGIENVCLEDSLPDFCAFVTGPVVVNDEHFTKMLINAKLRQLARQGYVYKPDRDRLVPPATFRSFDLTNTSVCNAMHSAEEIWNCILLVKDWDTIKL